MKFTTEQYQSPIDSFIDGLHCARPAEQARLNGIGRTARAMKQVFALALIVLIAPMTTVSILAQTYTPPPQNQQAPPPPPPDQQDQQGPPPQDAGMYSDQGAPPPEQGAPQAQGQPLDPQQLDSLVAPIALYPDALMAQVLAASTYPSEVVEADRWVQQQGNIPAEQLAAAANAQNWDPSVKALVAFPSVLAQMDKNIQWTTDLGNAYYNQPQDVMSAVQNMRGRAQTAGTLHNTPQQNVSDEDGAIVIQPANPEVVYVPAYNPWAVYGAPIGVFPGYYYGPPAGVYFGTGLAIGFGIGIGIGVFGGWGWGYHHWHPDWHGRAIVYNHNTYVTRSRTVVNHGWNRPGGPHGYAGARGASNHGAYRGGGSYNRSAGNYNRGGGSYNHGSAQGHNQGGNRGGGQVHSSGRPSGGGYHGGGGFHGGGGHEGGHGH